MMKKKLIFLMASGALAAVILFAADPQIGTKSMVPTTRAVTTGAGLAGGGDLSADRALTLALATLVNNQTMFDGSQATRTITFDLSGATDPILTLANNSISLNVPGSFPSLDVGASQQNGSITWWGSVAGTGFTITNNANGNYRLTLPATGLSGQYAWNFSGSNVTLTAVPAGGGIVGTMLSSGTWVAGDLAAAADTTGTNFVKSKVTLTQPATTATITVLNNKIFTVNKSITLDGTDSTTITLPAVPASVLSTASAEINALTSKATPVSGDLLVIEDSAAGNAKKKITVGSLPASGITASSTDTLTNKRITQRVATLTDAATVTPDVDSFDGGKLTTLSQTTTIANPTGTPTAFQRYILRIKSTTTRAISFGAQYRGSLDLALPTSTSGSSLTDYLVFQYNSDDTKWDLVGKNFGF